MGEADNCDSFSDEATRPADAMQVRFRIRCLFLNVPGNVIVDDQVLPVHKQGY